MTMRSRTSIGMKFLLVTGLFTMFFSLFLVYKTRQASYEQLQQMVRSHAELAMVCDQALKDAVEQVGDSMQTNEIASQTPAIDVAAQMQEVFETVWGPYAKQMIRAEGSELAAILESGGLDEAQLLSEFRDNPKQDSISREMHLDNRRYIAKFTIEQSPSHDTQSVPDLKMIAVPVKNYQGQIDRQIAGSFQILMLGLLGLLGLVYGIYQALIGRRLKCLARHLKNSAEQVGHIEFEQLDIHTDDEIGLISDCYNQLCNKLQNMYQTLEDKVQQRTAELEDANKKLRDKFRECQHAEQQATVLAHEAMAANRAKNEFLANMTHEIRTPMNAIMGFSEILAESELSDEPRSYVKLICESSQMLLQLIRDLLDFSKMEAGKFPMDIGECHIGRMLADIESMMRPKAIQKGLEFEILQCDVIPDTIQTDRIRMRQCLINLVDNAIKFTDVGHVYINVTLQKADDESLIRLDVEDTGIGIPEDKIGIIFDSFTQGDSAMTRKYGGTGLGLAITRKLCDLMGAEVSVQSKVDEGSVFTIIAPTRIHVPAAGNTVWNKYEVIDELNELSEVQKGMTMYNGKILVAEDNPSNQKLITILLQKMGLEVALADDGVSAVEKCEAETFDLILMDMQMPNMNGYEATRKLRSEGITTPVIAVTANAMMGDEEKCLQAGCNSYISKPIDRTRLGEVIGQHLAATVS